MAYDFANDANCVALYNFESGALTTDSKGTNTLTEYHSGTATQASSTHKEGSYAADLENGYDNQFYRADTDLSAGFPLKNGTTNKVFSIVSWFRVESFSADYRYLCSKNDTGTNKRCFCLASRNTSGQVSSINALFGRTGGTTNETIILFQNLTLNRWYHIAFTYDDSTKIWYCRLWDDSDKLFKEKYGIAGANIDLFDAPFLLGGVYASGSPTSSYSWDGLIDQFAVFNDVLTIAEIDQIRTDNYSGASAYTQLYGSSLDDLMVATILTKLQDLCTLGGASWTYTVFGTSERDSNVGGAIINGASYTKTVFIISSIHGLETGSVRMVMDFLNYLALHPDQIISGVRYIVIPIINPDAYAEATRKNKNDLHDDGVSPFPRFVDINRNFVTGRGGGNASATASSSYYYGPAALSEAESQIIDGIFDSYDPGLFFDCHTDDNYIGCHDDMFLKRQEPVDDALDALMITKFAFDAATVQGEATNDAASVYGMESYLLELAVIGPDQFEINRGLCALKTIIFEWDADAEAPIHNNFAAMASCVANYRFFPRDLNKDEQGKNNLVEINYPQATRNNYVPVGYVINCGDTTGDLGVQSNGYMTIADANLSSDFPQKSGGSQKDLSLCCFFRIRDINKVAGTSYIISKYSTDGAKRSWALVWTAADLKLYFYSGKTGGTARNAVQIGTDDLVEGRTYFIGITYNNSTLAWTAKLINAETDAVVFNSGGTFDEAMSTTDAALMLGAAPVSALFYFDVDLGAVQILNEVLTESQIDEIYEDTVTAGTAPPSELRQNREDISGANHDLADTGTLPTGNVQGKIGNAAYFSGAGQQLLTRATAPDLSSDAEFTISFRIKPHLESNPGSNIYWHLVIGDLEIQVGFAPGQIYAFASASTPSLACSTGNVVPADEFSMLTVYFDTSGLYIDVNNQNEASDAGANTGIVSPAASMKMGIEAEVTMVISVDEVAIWIGANALSAAQRTTLYSGNYNQRPAFA